MVLGTALIVGLAQMAVARAVAQSAADAAALAAAPLTFHAYDGVGDPEAAARDAVATNGAELVDCRCPIDRTWSDRVVVVRASVAARPLAIWQLTIAAEAAAEFRPVDLLRRRDAQRRRVASVGSATRSRTWSRTSSCRST